MMIRPGLNTREDEQKSEVKLLSKAVLTATASTGVPRQEKEKTYWLRHHHHHRHRFNLPN